MKVLLECNGLKLVQRYNKYYIRFIGGQMTETICEFQITDDEANEILVNNDRIIDIKNLYKKKIRWTMNEFINIGIREYMQYEYEMSEKSIEANIKQFDSHSDIKYEFYEYIMTEKFLISSAISEFDYTAEKLFNEYNLSPLGAYNYLIYLREEPHIALAELKKGMPIK